MNDEPTILTNKDIDKFVQQLMEYEIKPKICMKCSNEFFVNYSLEECDECYFAKFDQETVKAFYRSFFE